jgi:hypothetical protein
MLACTDLRISRLLTRDFLPIPQGGCRHGMFGTKFTGTAKRTGKETLLHKYGLPRPPFVINGLRINT